VDIRDNIRFDEQRRRDDARIEALQEQIDRLHLILRESGSRHSQSEETHDTITETLAELGERIEAARGEARALSDARLVEIGRLRADTEESEHRFSGAIAPIPSLQAQINDLAVFVRTKFQELGEDRHRFGELQVQIDRLPPQVERAAQLAREVRGELEAVRAEIDEIRADWRKTNDAVGIVEQDVRRRVGDLGVRLDETNGRIDALKDEFPPLDVQIDRVRAELHGILPRFDALVAVDAELRTDIDQVGSYAQLRHDKTMAQAEATRTAGEERLRVIERLNDTRFTATMARFEELEHADSSISHRLALMATRLDALRDEDQALRGEMRRLEELRLRVRIEQAQQEVQIVTERLAQLQADGDDDDDI
jgi:chromosome segregation ATPase